MKSYIKLKIKPGKDTEEAVEHHDKNKTQQTNTVLERTSIGAYLQEARVKTGLSINQVSQQTKIHIHYLEAIEREDFASTPPFIYVKAYVKKLCNLYGIDENAAMSLLEVYESEREPLPEQLIQNLEETRQIDRDSAEKLRSYIKLTGLSIASFIILLIVLSVILISRKDRDIVDKPLTAVEKTQLISNMEKLVAPQRIDMNELKPKNS